MHLQGHDFCSACLKQIPASEPKVNCSEQCDKVVYCSVDCQEKAFAQYHAYLCTAKSEVTSKENEFAAKAIKQNVKYPSMIARFLATMVYEETNKVPTGRDDEYNTWDHIDRLRFLEVTPDATEAEDIILLKELLGPKVPGIDEFVTEERYLTLKGKLLYNAYGVETMVEGERNIEVREDLLYSFEITCTVATAYAPFAHPTLPFHFITTRNPTNSFATHVSRLPHIL